MPDSDPAEVDRIAADCNLVVEAVVENAAGVDSLLEEVDHIVADEAGILAEEGSPAGHIHLAPERHSHLAQEEDTVLVGGIDCEVEADHHNLVVEDRENALVVVVAAGPDCSLDEGNL